MDSNPQPLWPLLSLVSLCFFSALLMVIALDSGTAGAHLDLPGPPAYLERINIFSAVLNNDTDPVGPGEIFLDWRVTPPAPHPAFEGGSLRVPLIGTRNISAPPAVNLLPFGAVLWRMPNCHPLERPVNMAILFQDDDFPFPNEDILNVVLPAAAGVNTVTGPHGSVTYRFDAILTPQFDGICEGQSLPPQRAALGAPQPASFARVSSGSTVSFTLPFTNTGIVTETFAFRVVAPQLVEPAPSDINSDTFIAFVSPADPAWTEIATPGAATGIALGPGQAVDLDLFVTPTGAPPGYYELELEAVSQAFNDIVAEEHAIVEITAGLYIPLAIRRN